MHWPLLLAALPSALAGITLLGGVPLDGRLPSFDAIAPVRANATLPAQSRVVLDYSQSALIDAGGVFRLYDVEEGEHILVPHVPGWAFPSLLITVPASSDGTPQPHVQIHHPGRAPLPISSPSLRYPIVLSPLGKEDYYTAKSGVNVLGLFKSPIVLMMLFSGVMMFALPKIMASVEADPEMKREMAEARKSMSGFLGGASVPAPAAAAQALASSGNNGSGNARRRK